LPSTLTLENASGVVRYSGALHDENARASIIDALNAVFGTDKIKGDIAIDANRADASWLANFRTALDSLKSQGVQAAFEGESVKIGGAIADADREKIASSLKSALGGAVTVGVRADKTDDATSAPNAKAMSELAALKPGFGARDIAAALNDATINFPSGGAKVPASIVSFLEGAAADLKQLPAGSVLEIAGYTDNTGDADANLALSQKRAESIRDLLIKAGVRPDMLVAKGYGSANPIASNDTAEGRTRNRRIEYHVLKAPTL
jgi:outer membrane protein OmpA-like peptidoglycan-associated protein